MIYLRILKTDPRNNRIVIRADSLTDLYILSTIIMNGDKVIAKTSRRIRRSGSEGRSGDESQRITMMIGVEVEGQIFQESVASNRLRIKGKIFQGPEQHVSIGTYHTLNISISDAITLIKLDWSDYFIKILKNAEIASKKPKICLIAIDRKEACVGLVDNYQVTVLAQEKSGISRKHSKDKVRQKQTISFFTLLEQIIQRKIISETKNIVIGGPGFVKERLSNHLRKAFAKTNLNVIIGGTLSGGNRVGLFELLKTEAIDKLSDNFQIIEEQRDIDEFLRRINEGTNDVAYGYSLIQKIAETGIISKLLVLDVYLHGMNNIPFEEVQSVIKNIEQTKGKIVVISSHGESASQLKTFGGIIALLRYALSWD